MIADIGESAAMSNAYIIDEQISGPNALRIEHERYDISADRYRNVRNSLDKTGGQASLSVFGQWLFGRAPARCAS